MNHQTALLNSFIALLEKALKTGSPFPDQRVAIEVLINPAAGSLSKKNKLEKQISQLEDWLSKRQKNAKRDIKEQLGLNVQIHLTESSNHAQERACLILEALVQEGWSDKKVLVLAGGDGFHKDILTALLQRHPELISKLIVFRLPLGTGNDSADCHSLSSGLNILTNPGRDIWQPCLKVEPKGLDADYCLNIASFGLDAYVCVLTERWKRLPGDVYKVMIDLAVLFYDLKYPIRDCHITLEHEGEVTEFHGAYLLSLMGAKGHSDYGGGKKILPNDHNVLLTDKISLLKRIVNKSRFLKGTHTDVSFAHFYDADRFIMNYPEKLLMELDGEVTTLEAENFPVEFTRLKQGYRGLAGL